MHLVSFTIEIYYDARPCKRQKVYKHIIIIIIAFSLFLCVCVCIHTHTHTYIYMYIFYYSITAGAVLDNLAVVELNSIVLSQKYP